MTVYPEALDTDLELPRVDNNITEIGGDSINSIRDAIFAIEATLGVNPQGNLPSLAARLNRVIDADGNLLTSALENKGLITLPIFDKHIGTNAAIAESKLDLDFSTSFLKGRSDSNLVDIQSLQTTLNALSNDVLKHYSGSTGRHDGYQIDLNSNIQSQTTIEAAAHVINNLLTDHFNSPTAHTATEISTSGVYKGTSVTTVQGAIDALNIDDPRIEEHQDELHDTAIAINQRGIQDSFGNLPLTAFASTIFETTTANTTKILQVMHPNAARVTGEMPSLQQLNGTTAYNIRVLAGGIGRSALNISLSSILPTEDIDAVVEQINATAHDSTAHYPISAYNIDGKLTIAHNIPGEQFTIQILAGLTNSAHNALGFGNIINNTYAGRNEEDAYHFAYVGGNKIGALKTLLRINNYSHSGGTDLDSLGLGDLSELGIPTTDEGRVLLHVTEHDSNDANGTYYIRSFPTTDIVRLNGILAAGTCNIEVFSDSLNFIDSARGEVYDVFLEHASDGYDGYGILDKNLRFDYITLGGASIKSASEQFPTDSVFWKIDSNQFLSVLSGGEEGIPVKIPSNFVGEVRAFAPNNVDSMLFEITDTTISSGTQAITMNNFAGTDDRLHLSSVLHSGNLGANFLSFVTDKRKLGGVPANIYNNPQAPTVLQDSLSELRNNGVIRGFDIISNTSASIKVRGGRVLANGRILEIPTQDITVDRFTDDLRLLALDVKGNYQTFDAYEAGYSIGELTVADAYGDERGLIPIAHFETSSSALTGNFIDRRLFVNKLDKRVKNNFDTLNARIIDIESTFAGSSWANTLFFTPDESIDAYMGNITVSSGSNIIALDEPGFAGGNASVTTRRYELNPGADGYSAKTIFIPNGMTHINVMLRLDYTGETNNGPFGVSGDVDIELGVSSTVGIAATTTTEGYANVRNITTTIFSVDNVREYYVASIPLSDIGLASNVFADFTPRIKINGSIYIDGGTVPLDTAPIIYFSKIRLVSSSYSIAGSVLGQDGSATALGATLGEVL